MGGARYGAGARRVGGWVWAIPAMAALLLASLPAGAAAQAGELRRQAECRCVDADGNEIENCSCVRMPRMRGLAPAFSAVSFTDRRARMGVWINGEQSDTIRGVLLLEVQEGGPAWEAGLRASDVVTRVAGQSVLDPLADPEAEESLDLDGSLAVQRFSRIVADLEPGEPVQVEAVRRGERLALEVTPEQAAGVVGLRSRAPAVMFRGRGMDLDPEELRALEEEARRMAEEMARHEDAMHIQEDVLREQVQRMQEQAERLRERARAEGFRESRLREPREPREAPRVFRFRDGEMEGPVAWEFRGGEDATSGLAFFGADPCLRLLEGDGDRAVTVLSRLESGCMDGVEFVDLNPELATYFDASDEGVLVTEVAAESTLGLRAGDVLLALDGREVRNADHARRILGSYELDEEVRLRILREGREIEVLGRRRGG